MSRPVAGIRNKTLVITLPGSPKGARENLQAIIKLLPHACLQAAGGNSRAIHAGGVKSLEDEAGIGRGAFIELKHHHGHSHHQGGHAIPKAHTTPSDYPITNDPQAGPSRRYRESPFPLLSVEEALKLVIEHTPTPQTVVHAVNPSIAGFVLAEDVTATEAVPAFRASIVDGYAITLSKESPSSKGTFPVASVSHAQRADVVPLRAGEVARITTGAPLPPGATAVVMVEDTVLRSLTNDGREEKEVEILTDKVESGENVREVGSDIKAGEVILKKGDKITAVGGEVGLLASVGRTDVPVYRKSVIGVMSTGDEIVDHDEPAPLALGEVRDCNRPTIITVLRGWGYEVVDLGIAKDQYVLLSASVALLMLSRPGKLEAMLRAAMRSVDVMISTGGVSMGELDLLKPTIERGIGGTIHFGRVAMKPGKPTTFATVPFKNNSGDSETRLIFSLPGNPASAIVTLHLFVLPSLQYASGQGGHGLPRAKVVLDGDVKCDEKRAEYQRATVSVAEDGLLHAISTGGQRSSRIGSLKAANALLCLPRAGGILKKGQRIEALLIGQVESRYTLA